MTNIVVVLIIAVSAAIALLTYRRRETGLKRRRRQRRRSRNMAYQQLWDKVMTRPKLKRLATAEPTAADARRD